MYHMDQAPNMWMPHRGPWTLTEFWMLFAMWAVMMVAMMLPSITPLTLVFSRSRDAHGKTGAIAATTYFVLGYLITWTLFSLVATVAQYALHQTMILTPMMTSRSYVFSAALLCVAGIFQLTPWKHVCLGHCRNSGDAVRRCVQPGVDRAFRIGFQHGVCCVGCCWALMALLFVTGVMDLVWVVGLAALVLLERLMPGGHWLARIAGVAFAIWGVSLLI